MIEVPGATLFAVYAIFFLAGGVKGVLGFGLPIITMSILPFIMPIDKAIVLSAVVQPATNIFQLISAGRIRDSIDLAWPVLLTLIPGIVIGAWFVTSLEPETLIILVGLTIAIFALLELLGYRFPISRSLRIPVGMGFGLVAGISGAMTALNGWAFITYLLGVNTDRQIFRSTVAMLFLVSGFLISSSFWVLGWLNVGTFILAGLALAAAFPGMWVGNWIGERLPAERFRQILLVALVCIGLILIVQASS